MTILNFGSAILFLSVGLFVGFALGYGVRAIISYRHLLEARRLRLDFIEDVVPTAPGAHHQHSVEDEVAKNDGTVTGI